MASSTKRQTATPDFLEDTSVTPLEKESLKSVDLKKGLEFFGGEVIVHVANQIGSRQKAYQLLYDLYLEMGITKRNGDGLWLSIHDALPETTTFFAIGDRGTVEGALTTVFESAIGLPADQLYKKEIDTIRHAGEHICEIISLGIKKSGKASIKILASLFYCAFLHAWKGENATEFVITVHSDYEDFYHQRVAFEKLGPERNYAKVNEAPTVLLNLSLMEVDRLRRKQRLFPFYMLNRPDQEELELAKRIKKMSSPMSDEEFFTFFIDKTNIWENASPQQKDFIKQVYPANAVNHYAVSRAMAKGFSTKNRNVDDPPNKATKVVGQ